jgi:cell division transport system ATP-binding protein
MASRQRAGAREANGRYTARDPGTGSQIRPRPSANPPGSPAWLPGRPVGVEPAGGRSERRERTDDDNDFVPSEERDGDQSGTLRRRVSLPVGGAMSMTAVMPRPALAAEPQLRPVISFHGVGKTYPNGTVALRDVNLAIHQTDFVFLVGASGAGKSTLVRLLIREEVASSGRIFVEGREITAMSRRKLPKLRRSFGIVFQDYKLLQRATVAQNVAFALQVTQPGLRHLREKVEEALWIVGLESKLEKFPDELSGGEQQRVAIARALVHRPRIFLADEPTGNLDPDTSWGIVQLLLQINHRGTTVVMATHNREVVDLVRRRVIAIEGGRVVRDEIEGRYLKEGEATI